MVHITRLPTLFLSLSVLATFFLASLVESAKVECESKVQNVTSSAAKKEDKYIVLLNSDDDNGHRDWLEQCYGITMKTTMNSDLAVKGTTLNGYTATLTQGFVKTALNKRKEVKLIEKNGKVSINYAVPNNLFKRTTVDDPQENLDRVDQAKFPLDDEYTFPDTAGEGVNIFVVDTGIALDHEQFGGRAKDGGSFCSDADACEAGDDGNGHGTHCAGTAGGKTVGVAPKATLIAIQVLDSNGAGSNADVIDGLKSVLAQHQDSDNKNSIVSMSLGGAFSEAVNTVVQSLTDAGIHVVAAAGNDGADACKASPASEPSAITVGALDSTGKKAPKDSVASFSNIGKCVDIFAPGVNIESAEAGTAKDLVVFSGTSQATPHVAGALALLISKDGNQSPAKMAKAIIALSTKGLLGKGELKGSPNNVLRVPAP